MKKITLFLLFLNLVFGQDKILNNWFKEYNTSGTFVFYDGKTWASNDFSSKYIMRFLSIKMIYIATLFIVGCSFLILFLIDDFIAVLFALALLGMGGGIMLVNNTAYLFSICPENARARAYGILASCIFLGQFLSPIISQPIVRQLGLVDAFLIWAILNFIVCIVFLFLKQR